MTSQEGTHFKVTIMDEHAKTQDSIRSPITVEMGKYQVITKDGLFKNGKHYKLNDKIELVKATAENFIKAGEIKEIKK